ncbi:hypothetical protein [Streptomyces sp. NPDC050560]|uniref:hypothetical protein n=1 Tax=Streptomyces sp. NPDC050560 TaxID=3365630 RepID=UPI00379CA81F
MRIRGRAPAVAVLALGLLALAGCGSDDADDGSAAGHGPTPEASTTPSATPATSAPATPAQPPSHTPGKRKQDGAADGTNYSACSDGICEIEVSEPVKFDVDEKFGITELTITPDSGDDSVSVQGRGRGILLQNTLGRGGTGNLNSLRFTVESLHDGTAVLSFSPKG